MHTSHTSLQKSASSFAAIITALSLTVAGCAMPSSSPSSTAKVSGIKLTGAEEVPPVTTAAAGSGNIVVGANRSVSGSVTTTGMTGTAAHIHEAPAGKNGPVIVPLTKTGDNTWSVPQGAQLTDSQYASYQAGNLYVNVHTAANPGGEVRAQLRPN